jgi:HPt (histidine-containing phosphotransfer) domain-containing protein
MSTLKHPFYEVFMIPKKIIEIDIELEDIVPSFVENRIKDVALLNDLIDRLDFKNIETLGHRLKGNAGGYGFFEMGIIGKSIEENAQNKNTEKLKKNVLELEFFLEHMEIVYIRI